MLIAMAGLPATGKSSLAARLADELGGVVLSKDTTRVALFPRPVLDYSAAQDDLAMAAVYSAAAYILRVHPARPVLLDGRTFLRSFQVRDLTAWAASLAEVPRVIECVCTDEIARQRLERDHGPGGGHPAGNRTFALYQRIKASAEPLKGARLVLDTGNLAMDECVTLGLQFVRA